jgi:hypothetical protein
MVLVVPSEQKTSRSAYLWSIFYMKNQMVRDLGRTRCYFAFAPSVFIKFTQCSYDPSWLQTMSLSSRLPHVQWGKLSLS